jgi:hypothetical protein
MGGSHSGKKGRMASERSERSESKEDENRKKEIEAVRAVQPELDKQFGEKDDGEFVANIFTYEHKSAHETRLIISIVWTQDVPTLIPAIVDTVMLNKNPEKLKPGEVPVICEVSLEGLLEVLSKSPSKRFRKFRFPHPSKKDEYLYFYALPGKATTEELVQLLEHSKNTQGITQLFQSHDEKLDEDYQITSSTSYARVITKEDIPKGLYVAVKLASMAPTQDYQHYWLLYAEKDIPKQVKTIKIPNKVQWSFIKMLVEYGNKHFLAGLASKSGDQKMLDNEGVFVENEQVRGDVFFTMDTMSKSTYEQLVDWHPKFDKKKKGKWFSWGQVLFGLKKSLEDDLFREAHKVKGHLKPGPAAGID